MLDKVGQQVGQIGSQEALAMLDATRAAQAELTKAVSLRWSAVRALWQYRSHWRLAEARALMHRIRSEQLVETMPFFLLIGMIVGAALFVLLPLVLPDQATLLQGLIWPIWVATAAPMFCAQTMALLIAPPLAQDMLRGEETGEFAALNPIYGAPAGMPALPWMVALSGVCVVASYLMIAVAFGAGLLLALMFSSGDVRAMFDAVLQSAPLVKWVRTGATAAVLGFVAASSVVVFAWPGTQAAGLLQDSKATHRFTLRAMLVCSISVALSGSAINGIAALFDKPL